MTSLLLSHAMTLLAAIVCGLAFWKGGRAEREASVLVGATWIVSLVAQVVCTRAWLGHAIVVEPYLIAAVDLVGGAGFLALALRHASGWPAFAVLIQGSALALHAAFLGGDGLNGALYVAEVNALGGLLLLLLLAATLRVWVARSRRTPGLLSGREPWPAS